MPFRAKRLTPPQERAGDSLWAGCCRIRPLVSGKQLSVQRGTAPHHSQSPHTQLLPLRNLHQGLLHRRHWWAVVFRSTLQKSRPVSVALLPHPAHRFTSVDPLSEARNAAQPAEEGHRRVQLELSRLLGKALLLLRPELPGQGGPPHAVLRQRSSHPGRWKKSEGCSSFWHGNTSRRLCFHRWTTQTTQSLTSIMSKLRSTCSAWELKTSTPEGPLAPGATARKCFPQHLWGNLPSSLHWLAPFCSISRVSKEEVSCQPLWLGRKKWLDLIFIETSLDVYSIYLYL